MCTDLAEIPIPKIENATSHNVMHGRTIPPYKLVQLFSADEWEEFINEWAVHFHDDFYSIRRFSGANDQGVDIAAFKDELLRQGEWINYQCKRYNSKKLDIASAILEIGKCLWYSFQKEFKAPIEYYFVASSGCAPGLEKLLNDHNLLKNRLYADWGKTCQKNITNTQEILLIEDFKAYVDQFDFKIFKSKSTLEIIESHRKTPYFSIRFGGGLPDRPNASFPKFQDNEEQHLYIKQLFAVYSEKLNSVIYSHQDLLSHNELQQHFNMQRERFFQAEALRNFARDSVPAGTFESLQDEIFHGVYETYIEEHSIGYIKINSVLKQAAIVELTQNPLISVTKVPDKQGICHQLTNQTKLQWIKSDE